jgi:hypothetical protein
MPNCHLCYLHFALKFRHDQKCADTCMTDKLCLSWIMFWFFFQCWSHIIHFVLKFSFINIGLLNKVSFGMLINSFLTDDECYRLGVNLHVPIDSLIELQKQDNFKEKMFEKWRPKRPYDSLVESSMFIVSFWGYTAIYPHPASLRSCWFGNLSITLIVQF